MDEQLELQGSLNGRVCRAPLIAEGLGKFYRTGPASVRPLLKAIWQPARPIGEEQGLWAVLEVSIALAVGESLGVIGRNGSGKSTLLRLLVGTSRPTMGSVQSSGRIAGLLDLGVGFNRLETGRENAERALVLQAGMTRREARARIREVEEFAGLGSFFDRPIRTYSDGMRLRLAFATITLLDPDVLITDEILAVGDESFQLKCNRWFDRFLAEGRTLVLCSHDLFQVQRLCGRALWMEGGRVRELGESRDVVRHYREAMGSAAAGGAEGGGTDGTAHAVGQRTGLAFEVVDLHLQDAAGNDMSDLPPDSSVQVVADILAPAAVPQIHIGITRADLTPVYGVSSDMENAVPEALGGDRYRYRLRFPRLPLTAGAYRLRAHALDETGTRLYDTVEIPFRIQGEDSGSGLVRLDWRARSAEDPS